MPRHTPTSRSASPPTLFDSLDGTVIDNGNYSNPVVSRDPERFHYALHSYEHYRHAGTFGGRYKEEIEAGMVSLLSCHLVYSAEAWNVNITTPHFWMWPYCSCLGGTMMAGSGFHH